MSTWQRTRSAQVQQNLYLKRQLLLDTLCFGVVYIRKAVREFHQIWQKFPFGPENELIRFWWSKGKFKVTDTSVFLAIHEPNKQTEYRINSMTQKQKERLCPYDTELMTLIFCTHLTTSDWEDLLCCWVKDTVCVKDPFTECEASINLVTLQNLLLKKLSYCWHR